MKEALEEFAEETKANKKKEKKKKRKAEDGEDAPAGKCLNISWILYVEVLLAMGKTMAWNWSTFPVMKQNDLFFKLILWDEMFKHYEFESTKNFIKVN